MEDLVSILKILSLTVGILVLIGGGFSGLVLYVYNNDKKAIAEQRKQDLKAIEKQEKTELKRHQEFMAAQMKIEGQQATHNQNITFLHEDQKQTKELVSTNIQNQEKLVQLMHVHDLDLLDKGKDMEVMQKDIEDIKEDLQSRSKKAS